MKGHQISTDPRTPQLDITAPVGPVQIEWDKPRGVLYVHIEGFTCLRIGQVEKVVFEGQVCDVDIASKLMTGMLIGAGIIAGKPAPSLTEAKKLDAQNVELIRKMEAQR